jgi:hypothetical protein
LIKWNQERAEGETQKKCRGTKGTKQKSEDSKEENFSQEKEFPNSEVNTPPPETMYPNISNQPIGIVPSYCANPSKDN